MYLVSNIFMKFGCFYTIVCKYGVIYYLVSNIDIKIFLGNLNDFGIPKLFGK